MNLSRSKQKNARALNPRSLLSLEKKTRKKKKKKKKKGTPRVVDRRGVLLLPQTEPDPSFVRARALLCWSKKKKRPVFSRDFFGGGRKKKKGNIMSLCSLEEEEEEEEGHKKKYEKRAFGEV